MKRGYQKRILTPGHNNGDISLELTTGQPMKLSIKLQKSATAKPLLLFLDHLVQQHSGERLPVLVLDNGSIITVLRVRRLLPYWKIAWYPCSYPAICSQLNPIERFWKYLKAAACANKLFPDMNTLMDSVKNVLVQKNDKLALSRFMFLKNFS